MLSRKESRRWLFATIRRARAVFHSPNVFPLIQFNGGATSIDRRHFRQSLS
jgi:hypothetical protein